MVAIKEIPKGYKKTDIGIIPDDWKEKHIGEIVSISVGRDLKKGNYSKDKDTIFRYPVFSNTVSDEGLYGYYNVYEYSGDSLTVVGRGVGLGTAFKRSGDYGAIGRLLVLKPNIYCDAKYLTEYINFKINIFFESSGIPQLTGISFAKYKVVLPPTKEEQTAIATALNDADELINSLEKLIAKKRMIKQGAMQELLKPKEGWEVKKLGEIGECLRGVSYNGERDLFPYDTNATVRLFRSNNIQNSMIVDSDIQFVHNCRVSNKQLMSTNDILICMANGSKILVGKAAKYIQSNSFKYTFGAFMGCFRILSKETNPVYVFYNFLTFNYRTNIEVLLSGSSINNLKPSDIESIQIPFPKKEIQTQISQILSDMDSEIEALEKKLEKYKMLKQGMMQNLLTGKIRLV